MLEILTPKGHTRTMSKREKITVSPQKQAKVLKSALSNSRVRVTTMTASQRRAVAASKTSKKAS